MGAVAALKTATELSDDGDATVWITWPWHSPKPGTQEQARVGTRRPRNGWREKVQKIKSCFDFVPRRRPTWTLVKRHRRKTKQMSGRNSGWSHGKRGHQPFAREAELLMPA